MNTLILALALLAGASLAGAVYTTTPSTSAKAASATCCDPVPLCPPTDPKCSMTR